MDTIGILGAGAMGSGIAQVASTAGHNVVLFDVNAPALEKAKAKLAKVMARLVEKGRKTEAEAAAIQERIAYSTSTSDFAPCSLVIEAIVERLDVKQSVFKELEGIVSEDCMLATNTSSLSVASIAAACEKPGRVLGLHFFNPPPLMPLVEVIPAVQSEPEVITIARALVDSWGKVTVLAKDTPGFIVNRVARPFYGEALRMYEESYYGLPEGEAGFATIDWAMRELGGFRMGPFQLMDFIGNDVNYTVTETVFREFYYDPRYKPAFTQKRLMEAGYWGRKTGKGYYDYAANAERPQPTEDAQLGQEILERVVVMLINEAADALFWQIASAEDIDSAMTKGVNYPKGLLAWADELGIGYCVAKLDALYAEYHEDRYRCSPLLRKMERSSKTFF